ncbi:hypothetical protein [Yinghuangia aomiensis]
MAKRTEPSGCRTTVYAAARAVSPVSADAAIPSAAAVATDAASP